MYCVVIIGVAVNVQTHISRLYEWFLQRYISCFGESHSDTSSNVADKITLNDDPHFCGRAFTVNSLIINYRKQESRHGYA